MCVGMYVPPKLPWESRGMILLRFKTEFALLFACLIAKFTSLDCWLMVSRCESNVTLHTAANFYIAGL